MNRYRQHYNRLLTAKFQILKMNRKTPERFIALSILSEVIIDLDGLATREDMDAIHSHSHLKFISGKIA